MWVKIIIQAHFGKVNNFAKVCVERLRKDRLTLMQFQSFAAI